ncbi:MAG TPA: amino acid racemase [Syntrophales bacterium]|nr:amino acid racemase [Syntrophales bacterium]
MMSEKTIGVLGGMGPEATEAFFLRVIRATKVRRDQDHLRILIDSNPKVPDRTAAIRGEGESPLPMLIEGARGLQKAGAGFIVIPCVTAHYFLEPLRRKVRIPILSIVDEVVGHVRRRMRGLRRIGLVATSGTVDTGLFQKAFGAAGIEVLLPDGRTQKNKVMAAIYGRRGVKAAGPSEESKALVVAAARALTDRGAQAVLAGCTEIPLVLKDGDLSVPVVDSLDVLARAAVREACGKQAWGEATRYS